MIEKEIKFEAFRERVLRILKEGLSDKLTYHTVDHILDVEHAAVSIAKNSGINDGQIIMLRTAALIHDMGFIYTYSGHEEKSCELAREMLPEYGYSDDEIQSICSMVLATKIPQEPKTKLEEILADADLDYLGRDDYDFVADQLYREMKAFGFFEDEKDWLRVQINFLRQHHYHTVWAKANRSKPKNEVLRRLESLPDN